MSIIIIFILLAPLYAFAFNIELTPEEVAPGNVFLLKIQTESASSPEAKFLDKKINFYPTKDGYFIALVPVDIDTPPQDHKILIKHGEKKQYAGIKIKPYKFLTKEITLPKKKVILSPENKIRVEREFVLLKKIWTQNSAKEWDGGFITPTSTALSETFGIKRIINGKKTSIHRGIDYKGKVGTPVKAINSGKVVLSDDLFYGGNTLIIDHGMGLFSVYMHLSKFNVSTGKRISKGQIIGFIGKTGRVTGPNLHISVKLQGISVNPAALFDLKL